MELDKMKNIWEKTDETQKHYMQRSYKNSPLEYKNKVTVFRTGEIVGLFIAYSMASFILFKFSSFDNWYLRLLAIILIGYLLVMPLYTLFSVWKMKKMDLTDLNCKSVLEQIYSTKNNLKKAEKVSFIASPILFIAAITIMIKLFTNKNIIDLNFNYALIFLVLISFVIAIFLNIYAFKKRDQKFKSVQQLLDEELN